MPDFRQRISLVGWVMALLMTLTLVWQLPDITWTSPQIFGRDFSVTATSNVIEGLLALLVSFAVSDSIIQVHPRLQALSAIQRLQRFWPVYSLPAAEALVVVVAQPVSDVPALSALGMVVAIGAYMLTQFLLYESLDLSTPHIGQFVFVLHGLAYITGLLLFLLVYQNKGSHLVAVPFIGATAVLLAMELLRREDVTNLGLLRSTGIVGLAMAGAALLVTITNLSNLTQGILLLWMFFLMISNFQDGLPKSLRSRRLLEYLGFSLLVLVLAILIENGSLQLTLA
ncbi:MAG: hypothetical protein F4Z18_12070 [Caldilineaceae bacterium SB0666_bin_21]|nr:hypothetical protein [Caldilineaceae bacterium SB0666_bin_21]